LHNSRAIHNHFTSTLAFCFAVQLTAATPENAPAFEWGNSASGPKNDKTRAINIDREGNVFLGGEVTDAAKFGDTTLKSAGGIDFFVAKLDPKGKFLWACLGGGSLIDRGYGVATDAAGDVIISGAVAGDAEFGDLRLPNKPGSHIFCAKYHADGTLVWARAAGGKASSSGHGIAVDARGNIYIGGMTSGTGQFGSKPLIKPKGSSALVAKLSPQGDVIWLTQQSGEPSCPFHEITCNRGGRVWASGMFKGKATLGAETFTTTGDKDSDAFLCHFDTDVKLLWSRVGTGPTIDYGFGVATDGKGNSFLTSEFTDTFKLGGEELHSRGATDVYVAKFDAKGAPRSITQARDGKGDNAYTIVCDAQGMSLLLRIEHGLALHEARGGRNVEMLCAEVGLRLADVDVVEQRLVAGHRRGVTPVDEVLARRAAHPSHADRLPRFLVGATAGEDAEIGRVALLGLGPEGNVLQIERALGDDRRILHFLPVDAVAGDERAKSAEFSAKSGECLITFVRRDTGTAVEKRREVVCERRHIREHHIVVLAAVDFVQAELRPRPANAIFGFRIAGAFAGSAVGEPRVAAVIHAEFCRWLVVNHRDVSTEAAFPRLVEFQRDARRLRRVHTQRRAFHFLDQQPVREQFAAQADGYGIFCA